MEVRFELPENDQLRLLRLINKLGTGRIKLIYGYDDFFGLFGKQKSNLFFL